MKDDYTTNSHYLTYIFPFRKVWRIYVLNLGVKGLIPCWEPLVPRANLEYRLLRIQSRLWIARCQARSHHGCVCCFYRSTELPVSWSRHCIICTLTEFCTETWSLRTFCWEKEAQWSCVILGKDVWPIEQKKCRLDLVSSITLHVVKYFEGPPYMYVFGSLTDCCAAIMFFGPLQGSH